jgi:hypothetical protein
MVQNEDVKALILDLFEEEALVIGGLVALYHVDDGLVWRLVRSMDAIRGKFLRRLEDEEDLDKEPLREPYVCPHPAIEAFLSKLREP